MANDIEDFLEVPDELMQRVLHIADARGGSIRVADAEKIVRAPWKLLAEGGHVASGALRELIESKVKVRQVDSLPRLLAKVKRMLGDAKTQL